MKRRHAKHQAGRMGASLHRAHAALTAERYELDLARNAIASLNRRNEHERARARAAQEDLADELGRLRRFFAQVHSLVGHTSMAVGHPPRYDWRVDPRDVVYMQRLVPFDMGRFDPKAMTAPVPIEREMLRLLRIKAVRDEINQYTTVHVTLRDRGVALGISDYAIDNAPKDVLCQRFADEIAERLFDELRPGHDELNRRPNQRSMPFF